MTYLAGPQSVRAGTQGDGEAPGGERVLWCLRCRPHSQQDRGGLLSEICLTPVLSRLAAERSKYPQLAARFLPEIHDKSENNQVSCQL